MKRNEFSEILAKYREINKKNFKRRVPETRLHRNEYEAVKTMIRRLKQETWVAGSAYLPVGIIIGIGICAVWWAFFGSMR